MIEMSVVSHNDLPTREGPRTCQLCECLSATGVCIAAAKGLPGSAPTNYRPDIHISRRCLAYKPVFGSYEKRSGLELWPELVLLDEIDEPGREIRRAIALVYGMLLAGGCQAREVVAAGKPIGLHPRTLERAATRLGVIKSKSAFRGGWYWSLPEGDCEGDKG